MRVGMQGRVEEAGRALAGLEWSNADMGLQFGYGSLHPFVSAVDRLAAGHWLLAAGDTAQALRLLVMHETDLPGTLHPLTFTNLILGSLALPTIARVEEARGHADRADYLRDVFRERTDLAPDSWIDRELTVCGGRRTEG
jgi:hypothetical protein